MVAEDFQVEVASERYQDATTIHHVVVLQHLLQHVNTLIDIALQCDSLEDTGHPLGTIGTVIGQCTILEMVPETPAIVHIEQKRLEVIVLYTENTEHKISTIQMKTSVETGHIIRTDRIDQSILRISTNQSYCSMWVLNKIPGHTLPSKGKIHTVELFVRAIKITQQHTETE